jgi:hypothetical protein
MYVSENKYTYVKEDMYIYMYNYIIVKINVYVYICLYIYVSKCECNCIYIYTHYNPANPEVREAYKMWASWQGR